MGQTLAVRSLAKNANFAYSLCEKDTKNAVLDPVVEKSPVFFLVEPNGQSCFRHGAHVSFEILKKKD